MQYSILGLTHHCLSLRSDRKVNKEKSKEEVCPHYKNTWAFGSPSYVVLYNTLESCDGVKWPNSVGNLFSIFNSKFQLYLVESFVAFWCGY